MVGNVVVAKMSKEEEIMELSPPSPERVAVSPDRLSAVTEVSESICPHGMRMSSSDLENSVTCLLCNPTGERPLSKAEKGEVAKAIFGLYDDEESADDSKKCEKEEKLVKAKGVPKTTNRDKLKGKERSRSLSKSTSEPKMTSKSESSIKPQSIYKSYSIEADHALDDAQTLNELRRTQSLQTLTSLPEDILTKSERRIVEIVKSPRFNLRRNALNNPFRMTMPQETRERIQQENKDRKNNLRKRISQYFSNLLDDEPEVDLIS